MLLVNRYTPEAKQLKPFVKYIWCLKSDQTTINHVLLPTDDIDLIINLGGGIKYHYGEVEISAPPIHINGLRSKASVIHQSCKIAAYGISFHSYGLYPFFHMPMKLLRDRIVDVKVFSADFAAQLRKITEKKHEAENIRVIEDCLLSNLSYDAEYQFRAKLIHDFLSSEENSSVGEFCKLHKLNIKTFERFTLKYTGYTPAHLRKIKRFQTVSNQLVHAKKSLLDIAYSNHYADQAHFNKEFKFFTSKSPNRFQNEKISIKENITYHYF